MDNYNEAVQGMDAAFSDILDNWRFRAANASKKFADKQAEKIKKDRDDMAIDQASELAGEEKENQGIEIAGLSPFAKEGGDWLGKKFGERFGEDAGKRVGQWFGKQGLNVLETGAEKFNAAAEPVLQAGQDAAAGIYNAASKGAESAVRAGGDAAANLLRPPANTFANSADPTGLEMSPPGLTPDGTVIPDGTIEDPVVGEPIPEPMVTSDPYSRGALTPDEATDLAGRNAARIDEAGGSGIVDRGDGGLQNANPREFDPIPEDNEDTDAPHPDGEKVIGEPIDEGGDFHPLGGVIPEGKLADPDLTGGDAGYDALSASRDAAQTAATTAENTATSLETAAGEGLGDLAGDAGLEAGGEALAEGLGGDLLGDLIPGIGWLAGLVGLGVGVGTAFSGSDAAAAAKAKAAAAAAAAAKAAAAVPPPPTPIDYAGRFIAPVQTSLAGL